MAMWSRTWCIPLVDPVALGDELEGETGLVFVGDGTTPDIDGYLEAKLSVTSPGNWDATVFMHDRSPTAVEEDQMNGVLLTHEP